ncbi:AMP-binding protein [Saccharopolyspora spinosa]|uniref:AMP-binding protein n=1 Tax=Saccharopolyspora spinosa TaxID=60894 RepID=UPI00192C7492|nr:AMP-binding protein [Saccharopolyspora spinosa]
MAAGGFHGSWNALPKRVLPPHRCAVIAHDQLDALAAVWEHHQRSGSELLIIPASRYDDQLAAELEDAGFTLLGTPERRAPTSETTPATPGRIWVSTSGSSGRPKRVAHTLQGLTTVSTPQAARRWLLPFTPGTYAWWQLVTLSLNVPGQDLVTVEADGLSAWPAFAAAEGVTAVSATPTFWRHSLLRDRAAVTALQLEQITLGGEPVDQRLLNELTTAFPEARVSWIYASTETGAAFAVHDGKAGFPVSWLENHTPERPQLRVADGELLVKSPYQSIELQGFVRTGDRAEIHDGRVHITGRISHDQLNIGGSKIAASTVGQVLTDHPSVAWAQVRARRAPLVGELVTAEVVTTTEVDIAELTSWCSSRLPDYAVPRLITFREEVTLKASLKSDL